MSAPYSTLTAADYLDAAQALLPSGPAWPRDPNSTFAKYMSAVANVAWLAHQMLADLFVNELDPGATNALLPDWEAAFGVTARGAKADRRTNLELVIGDPGGFSQAHFVAVAAIAGVEIHTTDVVAVPVALHLGDPHALRHDGRREEGAAGRRRHAQPRNLRLQHHMR